MAGLNVAEWTPDQVADWLEGSSRVRVRGVAMSHGACWAGVRLQGVVSCCRAGADGRAVRGRTAGARAGRAQAADAALRRPGVPRRARHRTPGAAARSRRSLEELCKCISARAVSGKYGHRFIHTNSITLHDISFMA